MKIALVHDYLIEAGGAERVLKVLCEMYPDAPIYTALTKNGTAREMFNDREIIESKWAWFLKIGRFYSYFRFLLPWVWGSMDLTNYDLIITSCSGYIARGFKVRDSSTSLGMTRIIAYCHTPPRWLYGYDTPTGAQTKWWGQAFMWIVGPFMRYFDFKSAQRVDVWIANSNEVAGRIEKFYRKNSTIIYPPVEFKYPSTPVSQYSSKSLENWKTGKLENQYYLMISRIVGGKGIEEAARAFKKLGIKLKIVGEIVDKKLGAKVESLGRVDDDLLAGLYSKAKGFVALAHDEDFGMTVVESMSYGTPVLAYNGGGYKETVLDPLSSNPVIQFSSGVQTGVLIDKTDVSSVREGIARMERIKWDREGIKKWADKFGRARFEKEIRKVVGR